MYLIKPIITEKSLRLAQEGIFMFSVLPKANKYQIKEAIETHFKVNVVSVNTTKKESRQVRSRRSGHYQTVKGTKKAIVTLKPKQTIDLFNVK